MAITNSFFVISYASNIKYIVRREMKLKIKNDLEIIV